MKMSIGVITIKEMLKGLLQEIERVYGESHKVYLEDDKGKLLGRG